jgi:dTDP-4-dehydrorhamnose reductase
MRCLVIGASGQVGWQLLRLCDELQWPVLGTGHRNRRPDLHSLDLLDANATRQLVRQFQPDVTLLSAAYTHVDAAQLDPQSCMAVNVDAAAVIADAVSCQHGLLVYFSTDHVFGECAEPVTETASTHAIHVYGESKVRGEEVVRQSLPNRHLILRTSWVYGPDPQGKNFVHRVVRTLRAGQRLNVPGDQYGQPTFGPDLARAALDLCRLGHTGTFHVVGSEEISRYDLACRIARVFDLDASLIDGVPSSQLGQSAPRPLRVRLSNRKLQLALGRHPIRAIDAGLVECLVNTSLQTVPS